MKFNIPVLLVTFNRPDTTKSVFEKLKELRPPKIYIYSDAPRIGNSLDQIRVEETRAIFKEINWDCEVYTSYQVKNLGCGRGVSHAINWVFEQEEMAIILEDDCVPHLSFFTFCQEMLLKYKEEERIMHIAGTRWNEEYNINDVDFFFSKIGHVWGWATWKRAWMKYDFQMHTWEGYKANGISNKLFNNRKIAKYWDGAFEYVYQQEEKHTWDYQWQFMLFANNGLAIVPKVNLISNIGISGVHASNSSSPSLFRKTDEWVNNNKAPERIKPYTNYDEYHMLNHFMVKYPLSKRIKRVVQKIFS